jgi:preprotein translocase subunit SecE
MFKALRNYLLESKAELQKVSWPSRPDLIRLTAIVIVVSVFVGGFIALLDFMFSGILNSIL